MNDHDTDPGVPAAGSAAAIEALVKSCLTQSYGIEGELARLPGENLNFVVSIAGSKKYVIKIVDEAMPTSVVELEHAAMAHAREAGFGPRMPETIQNIYGNIETRIKLPLIAELRLRIIEFIAGKELSICTDISKKLLENVGRTVAGFALAMEDFEHPSARRSHRWNLVQSLQHEDEIRSIPEPEKRDLLNWAFEAFRGVRPALDELPWQFIHGDAHDENLLVEADRVVGLIDFGDCCRNPAVCDIAICLAYLMMREHDPFAAARAILGGYQAVRPLAEAERDVLHPLICARLAVSLCVANARKRIDPLNPNWFGGEGPAWRWLSLLREFSNAEFKQGVGR